MLPTVLPPRWPHCCHQGPDTLPPHPKRGLPLPQRGGRALEALLTHRWAPPLTAGLIALCKGHVKELLRHPQGADVMIDLYEVSSTQLRNAMVREDGGGGCAGA